MWTCPPLGLSLTSGAEVLPVQSLINLALRAGKYCGNVFMFPVTSLFFVFMPVGSCFFSSDFVSLHNKYTFGFMCVSHVVTWSRGGIHKNIRCKVWLVLVWLRLTCLLSVTVIWTFDLINRELFVCFFDILQLCLIRFCSHKEKWRITH